MSTQASILAIGPFRRDLATAGHFEHDARWYDDVAEGTTILTEMSISVTADTARLAADILGIRIHGLGTHANLTVTDAMVEELDECFERTGSPLGSASLRALRDAGFTLHFRLDT